MSTLFVSEFKLDVQQRNFLRKKDLSSKNYWINGLPGSGKTVLLLYAAKKILIKDPSADIIIITFTNALVEMYNAALKEMDININVSTYHEFIKNGEYYDHILCDEVQDFTLDMLKNIYENSNHIIMAGDPYQSIYKDIYSKYQKLPATPSEIKTICNAEEFILTDVYRSPIDIINAAQNLCPYLNIPPTTKELSDCDVGIFLCKASYEDEEVAYIVEEANKTITTKGANNEYLTAAILLPNRNKIVEFVQQVLRNEGKPEWKECFDKYKNINFHSMNKHLKENQIPIQFLGSRYGSLLEENLINIITLHSSKGLEFSNVFIPYMNTDMEFSKEQDLAKTLFMVAMTRAQEKLYISYCDTPHDYLDIIKSSITNSYDISLSENQEDDDLYMDDSGIDDILMSNEDDDDIPF